MGFTGNPHGSPAPHLSAWLTASIGHARILAPATRSGRKWRTALPLLAMLALVLPAVLTACGGTSSAGGTGTLTFGAPITIALSPVRA